MKELNHLKLMLKDNNNKIIQEIDLNYMDFQRFSYITFECRKNQNVASISFLFTLHGDDDS